MSIRRSLAAVLTLTALAGPALAGSIRVENRDSKAHTVELNCSGSKKSMEIRGSTTSTYTFHSTHRSCEIIGGTITFPDQELVDSTSWTIRDGKATKN